MFAFFKFLSVRNFAYVIVKFTFVNMNFFFLSILRIQKVRRVSCLFLKEKLNNCDIILYVIKSFIIMVKRYALSLFTYVFVATDCSALWIIERALVTRKNIHLTKFEA